MKINTRVRYGIRAVVEIALHWENKEGVLQREIADRQEISFKYLDAIVSALKASGLIQTADGRGSGYILSREPEKITIYDVYKAFENELCIVDCLSEGKDCPRDQVCATREFWTGFNEHTISYLESKTIAELAKRQEELQNSEALNMFII